ncbi:CUB domain-containing protein isoform X1 [Equus przewalskii]|uniref:CUB domain-containing protein isoform X1 n=1 Tax=Equus przewalskii TaxID=9798 RepID=A0ABM4QFC2_EQUPR
MRLSSTFTWALLFSTAALVSTAQNKGYSDCGGLLTDLSGRISNYIGPKTVCVWTIQMTPGLDVAMAIPGLKTGTSHEQMVQPCPVPGGERLPAGGRVIPNADACLSLCPDSLTCLKEYVEIQDGPPGSASYGKICEGLGLTFRSSSNILTVKYTRKPDHPASSFDVYYYGEPEGSRGQGHC